MAKLNRRMRVHLQAGVSDEKRYIEYVAGPFPYLWFGNPAGECWGYLGDSKKDHKKLLRMAQALVDADGTTP